MDKKIITIAVNLEEYKKLLDDSNFLQALRSCGVDNWEGYGDAQDLLKTWKEQEAELK